MSDWFLYSGDIKRGSDLNFVEHVASEAISQTEHAIVVMCSRGGDPDAAYKMSRYLQHRYKSYSVMVAGLCKSAATLFAIGAKEIVFSPYGELGPLDIQLPKEDKLFGKESGLNINEAFKALEDQSRETFDSVLQEVIHKSGGIVSFKTASDVATGMVAALYGPIFQQIDPEEVGSRVRAMRIGKDYATRLDIHGNLKPGALDWLTTSYASHSFVIDHKEANVLFNDVRLATDEEMVVIESIGRDCRHPSHGKEPIVKKIEANNIQQNEDDDGTPKARKRARSKKRAPKRVRSNGTNIEAAV